MKRFLTGTTIAATLLLPVFALAAHDDVTMTTGTVLSVNSITLNVSGTTAEVESITVNATNFSVTLQSGSTFQVTAPGLERLSVDTLTGITSDICSASQSLLKYAPSTSVTVTITPSTTLCSSTSSGGGSSTSVSSSPTVTATPITTVTPEATTDDVVSVTPVVTATPATPASGLSVEQVTAILEVLASFGADSATIADVRAALWGTGGTTTTTTSSVSASFTRDLETGVTGSDVLALQQYLNAHGYTVATSGAGSPGNETTMFGALTRAAVIKFQKANDITPAVGYFGPKTRAAVNSGS